MNKAIVLVAVGVIIIYMLVFMLEMKPASSEENQSSRSSSSSSTKKERCDFLTRDMAEKYESKLVFPPPPKTYRSCKEIAKRLLDLKPPEVLAPKRFPDEMLDNFTLNGQITIQYTHYVNIYNGADALESVWSFDNITEYRQRARARQPFHYFGDTYNVYKSLDKWGLEGVWGKTGIVVGSERPWVESILLEYGARHLTTIEYGSLKSQHPQIATLFPFQTYKLLLEGRWEPVDFAYSFSSLEHSGLGRYGDPIDPFGDFEALQQISCLVKPGGFLFLGVPSAGDCIVFNGHRIYGPKRLERVFEGWHVLDTVLDADRTPDILLGKTDDPCNGYGQPVYVMQNLRGCSNTN